MWQKRRNLSAAGRRHGAIGSCSYFCSVPLYLYARLFLSLGVPYFVAADQTFFWQYALRMLHGEHVYHDFFQFTPPGLDLYFLVLFRLFGSQVWVANLAAILLGLALSVACFTLALTLMGRTEALLTALFFTIFIYGGHLDVTHHWFSLIASLSAVAVVMKHRTNSRVSLAGMFLAVASFFTQTTGIAAGIAIFLGIAWEHEYGKSWRAILRSHALLLTSFGATWLVLNAYFLATVGRRTLWYLQVTYPWHYIDHTRGFLVPRFRRSNAFSLMQRLFLYLLLLLEYPWVLWHCWRRRREGSQEDMQGVFLALTGLSLLLGVITRSNWTRLYAVSMPAVILWMRFLTGLRGKLRRRVVVGLCGVIICLAALQIREARRQKYAVSELYGGTMALAQVDAEEFRWVQQHTKPGDDFLQAAWSSVYLPLGLRSPVFVETLLPDRTPPEFVALTIHQMEQRKVEYILWSPWLHRDPQHVGTDNLQHFRDFMETHYMRIRVFSSRDEIWQRR